MIIIFDSYLKLAPIIPDHDVEVLEAGNDCDHHPADQEAMVAGLGTKDEHEAADHSKESIKDRVLGDGSPTYIPACTLTVVIIKGSHSRGVLDNVEDGGNDGDDKLQDTNTNNCRLQRQSTQSCDTGTPTAHFVQLF